jgi:CRISPR/Cas system CSM-associated protein Csm3 (group 7 of RAMP superfamily)
MTPIHVGGTGADADVDMALAIDGSGVVYIPGSGLAGALRAFMTQRTKDSALLQHLWGFQETKQSGKGNASTIFIDDAPVNMSDAMTIETRDGVGINRRTGSAAVHAKYDRAVLPKGTTLPLHMMLEMTEHDSASVDMQVGLLRDLLRALEAGDIRLGAAKTRGLGRVKLQGTCVPEQQILDTPDGMLAALAGRWEPLTDDPTIILEARPRLIANITWQPQGPLMVKAAFEGIAIDMLPMVSAIDQQKRLAFVVPGSSIKGALRAQAERIIRTLTGKRAPVTAEKPREFLAQLAQFEFIDAVFGAPGKQQGDLSTEDDAATWLPGLGALLADDCYSIPTMSTTAWQKVVNASDDTTLKTALQTARLNEAGNAPQRIQHGYHVAIDRWTGGVAGDSFFNTLELHAITWETIRIELDYTRLQEEDHFPATALFLLVLRELAEGRIPLGFGANRGMGALAVQDITFSGADLDHVSFTDVNGATHSLTPLTHAPLDEGKITALDAGFLAALTTAWQRKNGIASTYKGDRTCV